MTDVYFKDGEVAFLILHDGTMVKDKDEIKKYHPGPKDENKKTEGAKDEDRESKVLPRH